MDNNFAPTNVNPDELPEGFTTADPNNKASGASNEAEFKKQAIQEQKQMILEQAMDSEALARLGRIRMVKPDKAASVENAIVSMAMQGKLPGRITEGKLIEIVERKEAAASHASSINIQRKKCSLDSDDDDDDDDDV